MLTYRQRRCYGNAPTLFRPSATPEDDYITYLGLWIVALVLNRAKFVHKKVLNRLQGDYLLLILGEFISSSMSPSSLLL
jgi:hypothetical protein